MREIGKSKLEISENGFTTIDGIYSEEEINRILLIISKIDKSKDTFRKSNDLFAIRQFLKEIPETSNLIFNENLQNVINQLFG